MNQNVSDFQEAVFSVFDLELQTKFYTEVAGWKVTHQAENQQIPVWQSTDGKQFVFDEILLQNEGDEKGFLRLVKFKNVEQKVIRSGARMWDFGGIFDINIRVLDVEKKFRQAEEYGYNVEGPPIFYEFGQFKVKEGLLKGLDGIEIAVIQRLEPPLTGWDTIKEFSRVFNSSQIVESIEVSADFYIDKLGFKVYLKSFGKGKDAVNLSGIPKNFNPNTEHNVMIVSPEGTNDGSVELIEIKGIESQADYKSFGIPPNRGILTLRFPAQNLDEYAENLQSKQVKFEIPPTETIIEPYGKVNIMALKSPDGVWLEFFQKL